jgi:hypothetical protein
MVIATPICAKDAEERNNIAIASRKGRMNRLPISYFLLSMILRRWPFPVSGGCVKRTAKKK